MVCSLIPLMPQQVEAAAGKGANCVSAFGTSNFGNKLDQVHVSAKSGSITVYSVCYVY